MERINEKRTKNHVNCSTKCKKKRSAENSIGFNISSLIQNEMLRLIFKTCRPIPSFPLLYGEKC